MIFPPGLTEQIVTDLRVGKKVIISLNNKICCISVKNEQVSIEESSEEEAKKWHRLVGPEGVVMAAIRILLGSGR